MAFRFVAAAAFTLVLMTGCFMPGAPESSEQAENQRRLQQLGEVGTDDPEDITFVLDRLANGTVEERAVSAWALGAMRHMPAQDALREAAEDRDPNVRANAIGALLVLRPDDWDVAAAGLADPDSFVQRSTLSKMPDLTPPALVAPIGALLANSEDENVRISAADALGLAGSDDVVEALRTGASDESTDVRVHVAFALGKVEDEAAVAVLASMLEDESWEVRANACQALGKYRTPEAIDAVRTVTTDKNAQVRAVALRIVEQ